MYNVKGPIMRNPKLKLVCLLLLLASAQASYASLKFRVHVPGLLPSSGSGIPEEPSTPADIVVALSGSVLPAGTVGSPYGVSLSSLLSITGVSSYDPADVNWGISSSALPPGLALVGDTISGTPTAYTPETSFAVTATYMTKPGTQSYTIMVNGMPLVVTQVTAGANHTCAITPTGGAKCWGANTYGQLGTGNTTTSLVPVDVFGLTSGVAQLSAGNRFTCAVTTAGAAKCWGYGGKVGDGTSSARWHPTTVSGLASGVSEIATGYSHACAKTTAGGLKCWGRNSDNELGDGTTTDRTAPVDVIGLTSGVSQVAVGGWTAGGYTCAVTSSGGAKCWGYNTNGNIGNGTTTTQPSPVNVTGLTSGVARISTGATHTCAVTTSGGALCWGGNAQGRLGDGTTTSRSTPVSVVGLTSGVSQISPALYHTCAVTTAGQTKCWGYNATNLLGDGTTVTQHTPHDVPGLTATTQVTTNEDRTCVVTTGGGAKCWGPNSVGQLGDGTTTTRLTPVSVITQ